MNGKKHTAQQDSGHRTETLITLLENEAFGHSVQRIVDFSEETFIGGVLLLHSRTSAAFFRLIAIFRLLLKEFFWRELFWLFRKLRSLLLLFLLFGQNFALHLCNFTVSLYFLTQQFRIVIRVNVISVIHSRGGGSGLCCERHSHLKEEEEMRICI